VNKINYVIGDATDPVEIDGIKFIAHCCNNRGIWGSGFVLAVSHRWGMPELMYRRWAEKKDEMLQSLGKVQVVPVEKDMFVVNIIGQDGVGRDDQGGPPIRYEAIRTGLRKVQQTMLQHKNASLHMPRIGAARAGGDWLEIEKIIQEEITESPVYIYTLPHEKHLYGMK